MSFRLIDATKKDFPVARLCKVRIPTEAGQRSDLMSATIPK